MVLCDIWQTADVMICTASIMHMCTISLDRYMGIRHPLRSRNKSTKVVGLKIAMAWSISLALASPITIISVVNPKSVLQDQICAIFNHNFRIYGSLGAFFIPFAILMIAHILTIHRLVAKANTMSGTDGPPIRRNIGRIVCISAKYNIYRDDAGDQNIKNNEV